MILYNKKVTAEFLHRLQLCIFHEFHQQIKLFHSALFLQSLTNAHVEVSSLEGRLNKLQLSLLPKGHLSLLLLKENEYAGKLHQEIYSFLSLSNVDLKYLQSLVLRN